MENLLEGDVQNESVYSFMLTTEYSGLDLEFCLSAEPVAQCKGRADQRLTDGLKMKDIPHTHMTVCIYPSISFTLATATKQISTPTPSPQTENPKISL